MKSLFTFCAMIVLSIGAASAHNPLTARYYFEVVDSIGILNIKLSQAGLHAALEKAYPDQDVNALSTIAYKKLAANYVKGNIALNVNQQPISLLDRGIKLGRHHTDLKYITFTMDVEINNLSVCIPAFRENEFHQTIFSLSRQGKTDKIILNEGNGFSGSVTFLDGEMKYQINNWLMLPWVSVFVLPSIIFWGIIRKKQRSRI